MSRNFKLLLISIGIAFLGTFAKEWIKESRAEGAVARFQAACAEHEKAEGVIPPEKLPLVCSCTSDGALKRLGQERFTKATDQGVGAPEADIAVLQAVFASCAKPHMEQSDDGS